MDDDAILLEVSAEVFERFAKRQVDIQFDLAGTLPGSSHFMTAPRVPMPYLGNPGFLAGQETPETRQMVVRALSAAFRFYQEWSAYLPLRWKDCEELTNHDNVRFNLVGLFGSSLRFSGWDDQHPPFAPFVSGLMAYESTPDAIRNDPGLRFEFPPQPVEGLCDGRLYWRDPELIALERRGRGYACGLGGGAFYMKKRRRIAAPRSNFKLSKPARPVTLMSR